MPDPLSQPSNEPREIGPPVGTREHKLWVQQQTIDRYLGFLGAEPHICQRCAALVDARYLLLHAKWHDEMDADVTK